MIGTHIHFNREEQLSEHSKGFLAAGRAFSENVTFTLLCEIKNLRRCTYSTKTLCTLVLIFKAAYSVTKNIFRKKIFSF